MARNLLNPRQIKDIPGSKIEDHSITVDDLDTTTSGKAVITKIVAGSNISLSSTGVDPGTGVVTISSTASISNYVTNYIDCSSSDQAVQLPNPDTTDEIYIVKRITGFNGKKMVITSLGTNKTIDGQSSITDSNGYSSYTFKAYNGQWYII